MRRNNVYRNKLLTPLPRHLPRDICEFLNELIPNIFVVCARRSKVG